MLFRSIGDEIFFLSDREYTLNLYQYVENGKPVKLTEHKSHDSLWASAGPEALVYENDAYLWRYDPKTKQSTQLKINLQGNPEHLIPQFKKVVKQIESSSISADGKRAVFGARGEIFTVPAKHGEVRNISRTPQAREISVSWSPDGKNIAYLSDQTGEYEIYIRAQNGKGKPQRITTNGSIWRFAPVWSPNNKKLAFADKNQTLWIVEIGRASCRERVLRLV